MAETDYCPRCESVTPHVIIQYQPDPNDAQVESDDIPTDDLPPIGAHLCTECGFIGSCHPAYSEEERP